MENIMYKPVIGVVMCRNRLKGHQTQTLQEKYLNAICERRRRGRLPCRTRWPSRNCFLRYCRNWTAFICPAARATYSRTSMVKTAMSLTPIPGVIF
ncbi:gamma-glutamyl-gamma-aminobutyrate hydrolase [Klebsiella michiganensis]|nr:gamma-glutamyl-gamma-aminobutyrate hydrolase [Klebsiella michiganensis]